MLIRDCTGRGPFPEGRQGRGSGGDDTRREARAGIIDAAPLGHTYHALRTQGAYRNDRRIHVSDEADPARSLVYYSGLSWFIKAGREQAFLELVRRTERQRGLGDWYGFALVAQGSGEVMVEQGVHAWDIAAIVPIVEEAGGRFSDWDGGFDIHRSDALASNGKLHDEVIRILASDRK
jgi:histidinol-phosphatase